MNIKIKRKLKITLILLTILVPFTSFSMILLSQANLVDNGNRTNDQDADTLEFDKKNDYYPDNADITYLNSKYNLPEWWDTRFRFRIGLEVEELDGIDRYDPVNVYLTFDDNEHYEGSARLVSFNATGANEWSSEIPIQLWNITKYGPEGNETDFIESCIVTFLGDVSASSNQTYFLYYNENLDNIGPPSYDTNFQSNLDTGTLTVRVDSGSIYEVQLVEGQGVTTFQKDTINFHSTNSLAPERRLTDPRLVFLAHMDENSGTSVTDASGNLNPGQINGTVTWVKGAVDYGLLFGGSSVTNDTLHFDAGLESPGEPFNGNTQKWTMTAWIKPSALTTQSTNHGTQNCFMAKTHDSYNDNFEIGIVGTAGADYGKIHVYIDATGADTSANFGITGAVTVGEWNFVALKVDFTKPNNKIEVRINDNWYRLSPGWDSGTDMDNAAGSIFSIGSSEHSNIYYNGVIDEVAFYNSSLTDAEIESYKYGSKTATIDSISEIINGKVFSRYEVNWTDLFGMHISDICTFYYDYNLWNINRTIYFDNPFDGTNTNTQMIPLNTYYDLSGLADSEDFYYYYDGILEDRGLNYDQFIVENYTVIHDPIHINEKLTVGMFVPNFYETGPLTSISYFMGNVSYNSPNDTVVYKPGYINDFNNNLGGLSNQLHIEFWEFIDNILSPSEQLFENKFKTLKNPVNLYIYEKDSKFYNLEVNVTDIDGNLVPGVTVTLWNETDLNMKWSQYTDDSGEALFTRLNSGTYIVNASYEKYGKLPLTITSPKTIILDETTVDSTGLNQTSFTNVHLTSLNLTLDRYNSTNDFQGKLNGAKITFWIDSGSDPELIGSENSDENGNAIFRWSNFTNPSDGNITFAIEWFDTTPQKVDAVGDLDGGSNILNTTFYFYAENSALVNVTFGPTFKSNLELIIFPDPNFNQMLGDILNFQVNFTFTENETITYPLTGATVIYNVKSGVQIINTQTLYFSDIGGGLYNLSINTSNSIEPSGANWFSERDYIIEIEATKPGFITEKLSTSFILDPKSTSLVGNESSLTAYWGESIIMDVTYTDISFGGNNPIDDATVQYSVIGHPSVFGSLTSYGSNGRYQLLVGTINFPKSDTYIVQITANDQNYQEQTIFIDVTILAIKTLINETVGIYKDIDLAYREQEIYYFSYIIENTRVGLSGAETNTYEWTKEIGGSIVGSGAGSLNDLGNGFYSLDFDTETQEIAKYTIIFNLEKENYAKRGGIIILDIVPREINVTASKIISAISGQLLTFDISLHDMINGSDLNNCEVFLMLQGIRYNFTPNGDGTYSISINDLPEAFFASIPLSGQITINLDHYESKFIDVIIHVGMVEIFPGFPMFYFLMILSVAVAVVVSLIAYRQIQSAKIPTFVKKARAMSKDIKGRKLISDSLLYPSKEEYIIKKLGDKWESLDLSLEEILGHRTKKTKNLPEQTGYEGGGF
ncbi:MAG: LamG-like jellyroll fold domain-containing protein [Candidatus Hermodarchaeota archaeon]